MLRAGQSVPFLVLPIGSICPSPALGSCAATCERHASAWVMDFLNPDSKKLRAAPAVPQPTLAPPVGTAFALKQRQGGPALVEQRNTKRLGQLTGHF